MLLILVMLPLKYIVQACLYWAQPLPLPKSSAQDGRGKFVGWWGIWVMASENVFRNGIKLIDEILVYKYNGLYILTT